MVATDARRRFLLISIQVWDVAMLGVALVLAWRLANSNGGSLPLPLSWRELVWLVCTGTLWHLALSKTGAYASRRLTRGAGELWDGLKGITLGTAFLTTLAIVLRVSLVTPRLVEYFWLVSVIIFVCDRFSLRAFLAILRRAGRNLRFVLVVGSGPRGRRLMNDLQRRQELGYRISGYIDDIEVGEAENSGQLVSGIPYLGGLDDLPRIIAKNVVDTVFVALPMKSCYAEIARVLQICEEQGIQVHLPADFFELEFAAAQLEMFEGTPVLAFRMHSIRGWYALVKRTLDVVVSLILLIGLTPLFLIVAWLIKRDSPGPVFFVQERVGLNKRRFGLVKFRTMVQNSETMLQSLLHLNEASGAVFKIRNDPRMTKLGRYLRRTSIDELPQLVNVLRGEMSLVGPRPLPLRDVEGFTEDWQRRRFSVKPGITGLWQISGRSAISFEHWMEMDMAYIDNCSLKLDLKILSRTIPAVTRGTGAY